MFVKCIFCEEPRDGVVDHEECDQAGVNAGGHFLLASVAYGDEDY